MRPDVKVRLAQDSEREIVANLIAEVSPLDLEFKSVFPHWLVAEIAGEIVGTINIRISLPISSVEMLAIDSKLNDRERGTVFLMLTDSAMAICAAAGAGMISSMIPDSMPSYLKVAKRRGYVVGDQGSIVFGRIR